MGSLSVCLSVLGIRGGVFGVGLELSCIGPRGLAGWLGCVIYAYLLLRCALFLRAWRGVASGFCLLSFDRYCKSAYYFISGLSKRFGS